MLRNFRALIRKSIGHWEYGGIRQLFNLYRGAIALCCGQLYFRGIGLKYRYCPCCGWQGRRFKPYFAEGYTALDSLCPRCDSHSRHRGHFYYYETILRLQEKKGRLLYFAPEKSILIHLLKNSGLQIETTDYGDIPGCDHAYDIMNISAPADTFDYIICHRVVEHVSDDRKALLELYRVLKPGGIAIISVPISRGLAKTVEFGKPNSLCDNHFFEYGMDFKERIPREFELREIQFSQIFDSIQFKRLALVEDSIFECRKPTSHC